MTQEPQSRKPFHWKGLTSFIVFFSFLALTVSGIVLYAAPRGRIANWTGWSVLGLEKHEWSAMHMATSLLFVVAGFVHLYYNWSIFWSYFKVRFEKGFHLKREFAVSSVVFGIFLFGSIWYIPPFAYIAAWNDDIKDYWEAVSAQPPVPHAEEWTIVELAERTGMSVDVIIARFEARGYQVDSPHATLQAIAQKNRISPNALFALIDATRGGGGGAAGAGAAGSGLGRITVREFCSAYGVPLEEALARLERAGINARPDDRIRDLANSADLRPGAVAGIIEH